MTIMNIIFELFFFLFRTTGVFYIVKKLTKRKVSIVLYHNPESYFFKSHMEFLNKHYKFISLDLLVDAIKNKNWSIIPDNSIVVTIDDGHAGNFRLLETIIKYKIKPTIYCCSDIIGTNRHFWWKELESNNVESFKKLTNSNRLNKLKVKYDFVNEKEYSTKQALSFSEIQILKEHSIIGSHTKSHPILTCCDNNEIRNEIINSKLQIESIIDYKCDHFCYPNGDYNEHVIDIVKESGYKSARTIDVGWNDIKTDPYKLRITGITDNASLNHVIAQLSGFTMYLRYLTRGSLKGLHKTIKPK